MPTTQAPGDKLAIAACVSERRRHRLTSALRGCADVAFFDAFDQLVTGPASVKASIVILEPRDAHGNSAQSAIAALEQQGVSPAIILYVASGDVASVFGLQVSVRDLLIADQTDSPAMLQALVVRASLRVAAERVVDALRRRLSGPVATLAEAAARNPALGSVGSLAEHLGVHRQTLSLWCRNQGPLGAEELLVWSRLLLLAALLEKTRYSANALAIHLDFPSVIALRNQLKRYTGMTALEVRAAGFEAVLARFDADMAAGRRAPASAAIPQQMLASR